MNIKRLLLAMAAAYAITYTSDFLVHGIWLYPDYQAAKSLWRPSAEMRSYQSWVYIAQIISVTTFVLVWAMGFGGRGIAIGIVFGLLMGMSQHVWAIVNYIAMPVPGALAAKWFVGGVGEAVVQGIAMSLIYKPAQSRTAL
ncbi:MAG TPA: hypothetical protein VGW57_02450 [Chthoniobacterales bacterium]|nr:hypothetical protein [Chthoniobacterales bacterium]